MYESYNLENQEAYYEIVKKVNTIIINSYSENKKLARKNFKDKKELIEANNQQHTKHPITIPGFEIQDDFFEIELPPGVYELIDLYTAVKNQTDSGFELNIEADTISMKSVLTTSNPITFVPELNKLLGFKSKTYSE